MSTISQKGGGSMSTEAQKRASIKYDKENTKKITLKLNIKTDKDIIEWYESQENKYAAIKELIRADIEKNNL